MKKLIELLNEACEILSENNWRGDLVDAIRDEIALVELPSTSSTWCKMDYNNTPEEGVYWVVLESPVYCCDVDDYGNAIGTPTGKTKRRVLLAHLVCEMQPGADGEQEGYPVAYSVDPSHRDMTDEEYITHYAAVETSPTLLPNKTEPLTKDEIRSIAKCHALIDDGAISFAREIERWHEIE